VSWESTHTNKRKKAIEGRSNEQCVCDYDGGGTERETSRRKVYVKYVARFISATNVLQLTEHFRHPFSVPLLSCIFSGPTGSSLSMFATVY
jgi:hypothetical protein